jgi:hypothetical protein
VAGEHLPVGGDKVKPLVLSRPLLLHVAKEIAAWALGLADLVEVEGDRDAILRDEPDNAFVGQGARTEPVGVASAALQRVVA